MPDHQTVTITHRPHGEGGKYIARIDGENHHGYLEWEPRKPDGDDNTNSEIRVATHTVVPRPIGGRGIAGLLVERLIKDAREEGFKIVPQCSYVAAKFDQNPDWSDLRA